jgi:hypothetical protein
VVTSSWDDDPETMAAKDKLESLGAIHIDELLGKTSHLGSGKQGIAIAKLQRVLIPVQFYVNECEESWGLFFQHPLDQAVLRQIVFAAKRPYSDWPLARILLLGDKGSGKYAFARAFAGLIHPRLPNDDEIDLNTINSATLTENDLTGRLELFGGKNVRLGGRAESPAGCFQAATRYGPDGKIDFSAVPGVVFLDEFADMPRTLQAMILNALNEGKVRRVNDAENEPISIGCHVLLATNASPSKLEKKVRDDLIGRIPHVIRIPTLLQRSDQINNLLKQMGAHQLRKHASAGSGDPGVSISASALRMIQAAVDEKIICSMRELQAIADLLPNEWAITDSNLEFVLSKATILGKRHVLEQARSGGTDPLVAAFKRLCNQQLAHPHDAGDALAEYRAIDLALVSVLRKMLKKDFCSGWRIIDWLDRPAEVLRTESIPSALLRRWKYLFVLGLTAAHRDFVGRDKDFTWKSVDGWFKRPPRDALKVAINDAFGHPETGYGLNFVFTRFDSEETKSGKKKPQGAVDYLNFIRGANNAMAAGPNPTFNDEPQVRVFLGHLQHLSAELRL